MTISPATTPCSGCSISASSSSSSCRCCPAWSIWKPVQFSELAFLFYNFQGARLVHFLGMVAIVGFVLVHVALALIVPQTLVGDAERRAPGCQDPTASSPGADASAQSQIRIGTVRPCHFAHPRLPSSAPGAASIKACSRKTSSWSMTINRRKVLRGAVSLGALTMLTGCDVTRSRLRSERAAKRCRSGTIAPRRRCSAQPPRADILARAGRQAAALQRLLRCRGRRTGRRGELEAGAGWPDRGQAALDGRSKSTSCPSRRSSSATSASRDGTTSASGRA